jgi:hypothetical protein
MLQMGGTLVRRSWVWNPGIYAPASHRRSCGYDAFIPDELADLHLNLTGDVAGVVADAEHAIVQLNRSAGPEPAPLARLLLRSESIASSKVEGMQVDARTLARAKANQDAGRRVGPESAEILANIDAMQLAKTGGASDFGAHPTRAQTPPRGRSSTSSPRIP